MRKLPFCETFATNHHGQAHIVLAEIAAFVRYREERDGVTIVNLELDMDDEADYYGYVTIENPPKVPAKPMTPQSEWDASFSERH